MNNMKNVLLVSFGILIILLLGFFSQEKKLGTAVIPDPCIANNGIITCSYKIPIRSATTTACSRQSPAATSTIVHASFDVRTSTGTPQLIQIGKSTGGYATTTLLATLSLATNVRGTLVATSTLDTVDNLVIAPNNYVVWNIGATYGTVAPTGNCEVIFRVIGS